VKVLVLTDGDDPRHGDCERTLRELKADSTRKSEADVMRCLLDVGHEVEAYALYGDVPALMHKLATFEPDVVFNSVEMVRAERGNEPKLAALLDLLGSRYTGSGPVGLGLCKDKPTAKKILAFHGVRTADFVVSERARPLRALRGVIYPVLVKPADREASEGIDRSSYARSQQAALARARYLHRRFHSDALIERFIHGRELHVGALVTKPLTVFPAIELFHDALPGSTPHFATSSTKWNDGYRKRWHVFSNAARPLPPWVQSEIATILAESCAALKIRGAVRLDLRLDADGHLHVLEVNPNPSLGRDDALPRAAASVGICYPRLLSALLRLAIAEGEGASASAALELPAFVHGDLRRFWKRVPRCGCREQPERQLDGGVCDELTARISRRA
jgi:D-alanine-D-alanine ligase